MHIEIESLTMSLWNSRPALLRLKWSAFQFVSPGCSSCRRNSSRFCLSTRIHLLQLLLSWPSSPPPTLHRTRSLLSWIQLRVNQSDLFVCCLCHFFVHFILVDAKDILYKDEISVLLLFADVIADGVAVLVQHFTKQLLEWTRKWRLA